MSSMSSWFILTMKWGGAVMIILFAAALTYITLVTETKSVFLVAACFGFIAIGLAMTFAGFRWERRYLQGNE